jgi:hypothetical protein
MIFFIYYISELNIWSISIGKTGSTSSTYAWIGIFYSLLSSSNNLSSFKEDYCHQTFDSWPIQTWSITLSTNKLNEHKEPILVEELTDEENTIVEDNKS